MQAIKLLPVILIALLLVAGTLLVANTSAAPGTTIVVDTLEDNTTDDDYCSLREAITAANTNIATDTCPAGQLTGTDVITFSVSGTITLALGALPDITAAGGPLLIDGDGVITIDGDGNYRVMYIQSGAELALQDLRLVNGFCNESGCGLYNQGTLTISGSTLSGNNASTPTGTSSGGAIYNSGKLTITNSIITDNNISVLAFESYGGGIFNDSSGEVYISTTTIASNTLSSLLVSSFGGGVHNAGKMVITSSAVYSNSISSPAPYGGGISNLSTLDISNSTISHNTGGFWLYNGPAGLVELAYSTIADNDSLGIYNNKFITITASIINDGCAGSPITDGGDNLEDGDTCGFSSGSSTDPLLAPLGDYGGNTLTHALMPGSPAIDAVDSVDCIASDQRQFWRPVDGDNDGVLLCDIGAFEYGSQLAPFTTTTTITSHEPNPSYVNQPFTVTTMVSSTIGIPTGTVTVTVEDSDDSCASSLVAGASSCQLVLTGPGTYTLTATYSGESPFAASTTSVQHIAVKAPTTTTILSDLPDPSMVGEYFEVSFEVTSPFSIPSGKVSVYVIDTTDTCSSKLVDGSGSCLLSISKPGLQTLTVSYNGNATYLPSSTNEEHTVESSEPPPEPGQDIYLPLVIGG